MDPNHLSKTRRIATLRRGLCQLPTLPAGESDRGKVIHAKVREYLAMWSKSKQAPQDVTIGLISTFFADNLNVIDCRGTLAKYSRSTQSVGPKPLVRVWYGDSEATLGRCWDRSQIYNVVHIVLREDGKIDEGLVDVEAPFTLNIVIARADEDKGKTPKTSITEEHWFTSAIAGHGTMRAPMYDTCTLEHKLQGIAVSVEAWIIAGLTRGPKQAQVDYVKSAVETRAEHCGINTV